jgi:large subunit ribosomal protein L4
VLVVIGRDDANAALSFRNLTQVQVISPGELNTYDVLCNDWIVFSKDVVPAADGSAAVTEAPAESAQADKPAAKKAAAKKAPAKKAAAKPKTVKADTAEENEEAG